MENERAVEKAIGVIRMETGDNFVIQLKKINIPLTSAAFSQAFDNLVASGSAAYRELARGLEDFACYEVSGNNR